MNIFWKIYFVVVLLLALGSLSFLNSASIADTLNLADRTIGVVGLYGFVFGKKIASMRFWKIFLPCSILWNIFILFIVPSGRMSDQVDLGTYVFLLTALIVFLLPQYYAIYRYGRSQKIFTDLRGSAEALK